VDGCITVPIVEASVADWALSHDHPLGERLSTIALLAEALDSTTGSVTAELRAVPWTRYADRYARRARRLWAWRDAVASERTWSDHLGRRAAALGEESTWMDLTSSGW
jgi:hypothetical protein